MEKRNRTRTTQPRKRPKRTENCYRSPRASRPHPSHGSRTGFRQRGETNFVCTPEAGFFFSSALFGSAFEETPVHQRAALDPTISAGCSSDARDSCFIFCISQFARNFAARGHASGDDLQAITESYQQGTQDFPIRLPARGTAGGFAHAKPRRSRRTTSSCEGRQEQLAHAKLRGCPHNCA